MRSHDPRRAQRQFRRTPPAAKPPLAAMKRGLRRAIVIVFLAFAAVGSYYAWTGPESASSAERAPLMVVEAPRASGPLGVETRRENPRLDNARREESSRSVVTPTREAPAESAPPPTPSQATAPPVVIDPAGPIGPVAVKPIPIADVVTVRPVVEDVIEILPPRAAAEFESDEVEPEPVDPATGGVGSDPTDGAGARRHRVESGETLSSIAVRYYGDASAWRRVAAANPGLDVDRLAIGMVILVPAADASPVSPVAEPEVPASGRTHVVAEGETLSSIAAEIYGDSSQWRRLYEANRAAIGSDPGAIRVGMQLVVPAR